jgi:thiosulfate reductase cytochrome b subunit
MATSARASASVPSKNKTASGVGRYFYFFMSLLVAAVVIYGFSHTVDQNLIHAAPPRPWLLWVHGTLFSAWVAFFIVQSGLVRTHNV